MAKGYTNAVKPEPVRTPMTKAIPGREPEMVAMPSGGYGFKITALERFQRFLAFGADTNTFYLTKKQVFAESLGAMTEMLRTDPYLYVETATLALRNRSLYQPNTAIFALAYATSPEMRKLETGADTKRDVYVYLSDAIGIPTHLFAFLAYQDALGVKWPRSRRTAIGNWYVKDRNLAYHLIKYQGRTIDESVRWTNRDALILSHPTPADDLQSNLFALAVKGVEDEGVKKFLMSAECPAIVKAWYAASLPDATEKVVIALIREVGLTHEMIPPEFKASTKVWAALLERMPYDATIRNLGNLSARGLLAFGSPGEKLVIDRIGGNAAKMHPFRLWAASQVYQKGKGVKGKLTWNVNQRVRSALDGAFMNAFQYLPTNEDNMVVVAVDTSGSMSSCAIEGLPGNCQDAAAVIAAVLGKQFKRSLFLSFNENCRPLGVAANDSYAEFVRACAANGGGSTDPTQVMDYLRRTAVKADALIFLTDGQAWSGKQHLAQALKDYRQFADKPTVMITGTLANYDGQLCDPLDSRSMDIVGINPNVPEMMAKFVKGGYGAVESNDTEMVVDATDDE